MNPSETTLETIFGMTIVGLKIEQTPYIAFGYLDEHPIQRRIAPYGLGKISVIQIRFPEQNIELNEINNVTHFSLYNGIKNENELYEIHKSFSTTPKIKLEKIPYKDYSEMVNEMISALNESPQKKRQNSFEEYYFPISAERKTPSAKADSIMRKLH